MLEKQRHMRPVLALFALIFTVSDHEAHNDSLWTYIIGTYIIGQRVFAGMSLHSQPWAVTGLGKWR